MPVGDDRGVVGRGGGRVTGRQRPARRGMMPMRHDVIGGIGGMTFKNFHYNQTVK